MTRTRNFYTPNNAQAATGIGEVIPVKDYKIIVVSISTSGNANLTIKSKGAILEDPSDIDFEATASPTNDWGYVGLYKYNDANIIVGSTGVVFAGTDGTALYEVNVSGLTALAFDVEARSAGAVTVKLVGFTNQ